MTSLTITSHGFFSWASFSRGPNSENILFKWMDRARNVRENRCFLDKTSRLTSTLWLRLLLLRTEFFSRESLSEFRKWLVQMNGLFAHFMPKKSEKSAFFRQNQPLTLYTLISLTITSNGFFFTSIVIRIQKMARSNEWAIRAFSGPKCAGKIDVF